MSEREKNKIYFIGNMIQLLCFSGLVPMMAEYRFLDKVKWLDMYGVDLHPVMVSLLDSLSLHCFDTITNFFFVVKLCIFFSMLQFD